MVFHLNYRVMSGEPSLGTDITVDKYKKFGYRTIRIDSTYDDYRVIATKEESSRQLSSLP